MATQIMKDFIKVLNGSSILKFLSESRESAKRSNKNPLYTKLERLFEASMKLKLSSELGKFVEKFDIKCSSFLW